MTYEEAVAYLEGLIDLERSRLSYENQKLLKLDRVSALLEGLGNPHRRLRCVHVAGTKGKGSTCAFVESVLRAAGYRVGLYTSPGLVDFRERIQIDRMMISRAHLVESVERLRPCVEAIDIEAIGEVTYFEALTVIGIDYFVRQGVDFAVLEVGLGGRLDATNVVTPLVSAITPISFDHTRILGRTLNEIAFEKAGIIKPGRPVASAAQQEEAGRVIRERAAEEKAHLVELGRNASLDLSEEGLSAFNVSSAIGAHSGLKIALSGGHQAHNAALAVLVCDFLRQEGISIPEEALGEGLLRADWPGRLQVVQRQPTVVLDGAHTPDSARSLVSALQRDFPHRRLFLLFGISADKDISGVWRILERVADVAYLCKSGFYSHYVRSAPPDTVWQMVYDTHVDLRIEADPARALERALEETGPDDLICVTGSLYLVGDIMQTLGICAQQEMPEPLSPASVSHA